MMYYGIIHSYIDSRNYLREHPHLLCKFTGIYLSNWCLVLEIQEKHSLMECVAHQVKCMHSILDLAKSQNCDPRAVVHDFCASRQESKDEMFEKVLGHFKENATKAVKLLKV